MPNDGIAITRVPVVKIKPDHDNVVEDQDMDEDDPDGNKPMDIDQVLKDTGQAPGLKDDELDTEPVDAPIKHAVKNAAEE